MPPTLLNLDDRRWGDLVEEGRSLVPLYAPEWTDHNVHDPGITLIELLAWLTEMDIFQLNRIPDAHRRKFLAMVGVEPAPPRAAHTVLSLGLNMGATALHLPAGIEFEGDDAHGVQTRFRTLNEVTVVDAHIVAIQAYDGEVFRDIGGRWLENGTDFMPAFYPFGEEPRPGAALYLGFDSTLPPTLAASLYLGFTHSSAGARARRALEDEIAARRNACEAFDPCAEVESVPYRELHHHRGSRRPDSQAQRASLHRASLQRASQGTETRLMHHAARTVWEFFNQHGRWQRLREDEADDDTRAFTLDGRIVLTLPEVMGAVAVGEVDTPYFYLRCRLVGGSFDAAPELRILALNGVAAEQANTPDALDTPIPEPHVPGWAELLGKGNGQPFQRLQTAQHPVVTESFRLYVETAGGVWREWTRRSDFYASQRADTHFMLDPTRGEIICGDGDHGQTLPKDANVWASYLATRAERGNLVARAVQRLAESELNNRLLSQSGGLRVEDVRNRLAYIANPEPAHGGASAESLLHAQGRALQLLEEPTRAITLADYEGLAQATPGVRLARVTAIANLYAAFPCLRAVGVITVIVLPDLPRKRPMPSAGLRRAVATHLEWRRVIGTRVEVVGPAYTRVTVEARVRPCPQVDVVALRERIVARLHRFFDPLTGGPDGVGWPFGRDVYRTEVLQQIDEAEGVDYVSALSFIGPDGESLCDNVCLPPIGLVESGAHRIEIEGGEIGGKPCRD